MQGIKDLGLAEETLVLLLVTMVQIHGMKGKTNLELTWTKRTICMKVVFACRLLHIALRKIAPNQYNSQSIFYCSVDLFPTLCSLTGTPLPTDFQPDGLDRSSILLGGGHEDRSKPLFWQFGKFQSNPKSPHIAVREGDWKLLVDVDGGRTELYNMKTDFLETKNVATENPLVTNRLKSMALDWFDEAYRQYADWPSDVGEILKNDNMHISQIR